MKCALAVIGYALLLIAFVFAVFAVLFQDGQVLGGLVWVSIIGAFISGGLYAVLYGDW